MSHPGLEGANTEILSVAGSSTATPPCPEPWKAMYILPPPSQTSTIELPGSAARFLVRPIVLQKLAVGVELVQPVSAPKYTVSFVAATQRTP